MIYIHYTYNIYFQHLHLPGDRDPVGPVHPSLAGPAPQPAARLPRPALPPDLRPVFAPGVRDARGQGHVPQLLLPPSPLEQLLGFLV